MALVYVQVLFLFEKYKDVGSVNFYLLICSDEEQGLQGAENVALHPFLPKNAFVFNVDAECPHEICAGSAGGSICKLTRKLNYDKTGNENLYDHQYYDIELTGFKGGHSGVDINKGRASAIKILASIFTQIEGLHVGKFEGGNATNAIPIYAKATFNGYDYNYNDDGSYKLSRLDIDALTKKIETIIESVKVRYNEPNIKFTITPNPDKHQFIYMDDIIEFIDVLHQGIINMNPYNNECVDTSTNVGIVKIVDDQLTMEIMSRSGDITSMKDYQRVIKKLAMKYGMSVESVMFRTGWAPNWNTSKVLEHLKVTHEQLFGSKPKVFSVHAGLECGVLLAKYPDWDIMAIGPRNYWSSYV